MLLPSIDVTKITLLALREQYRLYVLNIRNLCTDTVREKLRYLGCLFEYFGEPETVAELFVRLNPSTLTEFLLDYATGHGPGTRKAMHATLRGFQRLCKHCGLSEKPPPRLHDPLHNYACLRLALWREESRDVNAMLPVLATAMGHANIMHTQVYLHMELGDLRHAATLLNTHLEIKK